MTAYNLLMPDVRTTSVVFASPHSGREYPWSFVRRTILDEQTLRSSEDAFVDKLFDQAPRHGAPLLTAIAPRAWIDVNRSSDELDPALIEGVRRTAHNPRGKNTLKEAKARIDEFWTPWHQAVGTLMDDSISLFGEAILIDCHSMPHEAIETISHPRGKRPEIVLGDRFGAASASDVVDRIEAILTSAGFRVARNAPFAGAFVTQHYGRPARSRHVVQVEIDRALYMNEQQVRPNNNFAAFKALIDRVVADITEIGRTDMAVAAE